MRTYQWGTTNFHPHRRLQEPRCSMVQRRVDRKHTFAILSTTCISSYDGHFGRTCHTDSPNRWQSDEILQTPGWAILFRNQHPATGDHSFVSTVVDNKALFVAREIDAADKARELYRKLGRPSQQQFEDILSKNVIMNCPVTVDDAKRAMLIYGPDLATLKGKTTRGKFALHVASFKAVPTPAPILEHH
jgi:hypothetical protein